MRGLVPDPDALLDYPGHAGGEASHHFHIEVHLLHLVSMVVNNVLMHNATFAYTIHGLSVSGKNSVTIRLRMTSLLLYYLPKGRQIYAEKSGAKNK